MRIFSGERKTTAFAIMFVMATSMLSALSVTTTVSGQIEVPRDQTVVLSHSWGPPAGVNPLQAAQIDFGGNLMYPTLFVYSDYSNEWIPYLAESYRWLDKITLQVKLRDAAKWDDGQAITADDVKYSIELGKKYTVAQYSSVWTYIEKITVPSAGRVNIYVNQSTLNYMKVFGLLYQCEVLPKHRWEALETQYGDKITSEFQDLDPTKIVGGGPYKLMSVSTVAWIYERVDDWWGKDIFGVPNVKYIAHEDFRDNAGAALAIEAGDLDESGHFIPAVYDLWQTKHLARGTYYDHAPYFAPSSPIFFYMNWAKEGLDNPTVRRAIAMALPVSEFIAGPMFNYTSPSTNLPIIEAAAGAYINQSLLNQYGWTYDIAGANKILDDAGITRGGDGIRVLNGKKLEFVMSAVSGWSDFQAIADIVAETLPEIGIGCTTQFLDFGVWFGGIMAKTLDIYMVPWSGDVLGVEHPWNAFGNMMDPRTDFPAANFGHYQNTAVIPLIDAIPSEGDPAKLMSLYSQLEEIWLKDVVAVPLVYGGMFYVYSNEYWVGWANSTNNFWYVSMAFQQPTSGFNMFPSLFTLAPKGQTPVEPAWVSSTKFSSDTILADLTAAPYRTPDANGDGIVNILDIFIVAQAFGAKIGDARFDTRADLNGDGDVNILDIFAVAKSFGKPV